MSIKKTLKVGYIIFCSWYCEYNWNKFDFNYAKLPTLFLTTKHHTFLRRNFCCAQGHFKIDKK